MVGSVKTAKATPPASAEDVPVERTTTENANTPQIIEGIPVKSLATNRTILARRDLGLY